MNLNWNYWNENPSWITLHKNTTFQDAFSKIGYWVYVKINSNSAMKILAEEQLKKLIYGN